jgi:hypothetical protein
VDTTSENHATQISDRACHATRSWTPVPHHPHLARSLPLPRAVIRKTDDGSRREIDLQPPPPPIAGAGHGGSIHRRTSTPLRPECRTWLPCSRRPSRHHGSPPPLPPEHLWRRGPLPPWPAPTAATERERCMGGAVADGARVSPWVSFWRCTYRR